jgi:hypothetical protein
MEKGYISLLHKNTLAYNLVHHTARALQLNDEDRKKVAAIIDSILANFEYKEL